MSTMFTKLHVDQLRKVAEDFAVDLEGVKGKPNIIKAIEADGVTYEMYKDTLETAPAEEDLATLDDAPLDEPEPKKLEPSDTTTLVKMTRRNASYEVRGYRFTQRHPYALVSDEDADFLIEKGGGFRPASKKEFLEFYGN